MYILKSMTHVDRIAYMTIRVQNTYICITISPYSSSTYALSHSRTTSRLAANHRPIHAQQREHAHKRYTHICIWVKRSRANRPPPDPAGSRVGAHRTSRARSGWERQNDRTRPRAPCHHADPPNHKTERQPISQNTNITKIAIFKNKVRHV